MANLSASLVRRLDGHYKINKLRYALTQRPHEQSRAGGFDSSQCGAGSALAALTQDHDNRS
jgi:hypothetical protein